VLWRSAGLVWVQHSVALRSAAGSIGGEIRTSVCADVPIVAEAEASAPPTARISVGASDSEDQRRRRLRSGLRVRRCAPHLAWMRRRVQCEPRRRRHDQPAIWCSTIRSRWHRSADPGARPRCSRATGTSVHPPVDRQLASVVASDRSSSGRATVNWTELTSQSEGLLSPSQSRHRGHDRERSISGHGGRWVRLA